MLMFKPIFGNHPFLYYFLLVFCHNSQFDAYRVWQQWSGKPFCCPIVGHHLFLPFGQSTIMELIRDGTIYRLSINLVTKAKWQKQIMEKVFKYGHFRHFPMARTLKAWIYLNAYHFRSLSNSDYTPVGSKMVRNANVTIGLKLRQNSHDICFRFLSASFEWAFCLWVKLQVLYNTFTFILITILKNCPLQ